MPTLYLLRHVKSSWDDGTLDDFDRPLAPRGERAAGALAAYLRQNRVRPELVLCSSARRTRDTLAGVRIGLPKNTRVETTRALYEVGAGKILRQLRAIEPSTGCVLVVGHNPGMEDLARMLAGKGSDAAAVSDMMRKYPTGGLAQLEFEGDWADLGPGSARLSAFVIPKDLV